jgi:hypothetical protein
MTKKQYTYGEGRIFVTSFLNDCLLAYFVMLGFGILHTDWLAVPLLGYGHALVFTFLVTSLISGGLMATSQRLSTDYVKNVGTAASKHVENVVHNGCYHTHHESVTQAKHAL